MMSLYPENPVSKTINSDIKIVGHAGFDKILIEIERILNFTI